MKNINCATLTMNHVVDFWSWWIRLNITYLPPTISYMPIKEFLNQRISKQLYMFNYHQKFYHKLKIYQLNWSVRPQWCRVFAVPSSYRYCWHCGHKNDRHSNDTDIVVKWHHTWPLYAIELLSNCRFVLSGYHKNRWGVGEKSFLCRSPLWTKESKPFDFLSRSKQPILIKFGASIPWHQLYYYTFQISEISDHFMVIWKNTRFSYGDLLWIEPAKKGI